MAEDPLDRWLENPRVKMGPVTPPKEANQGRRPRKITGIAPVFDRPQSYEDFLIINAARTGQFGSPPQITIPQKKSFWQTLSITRLINRFVHNWIVEEIWLVMNKLTLFGLVMGLMFLGIVFFVVGFLTAYQSNTVLNAGNPGVGVGSAPGQPGMVKANGTVNAGLVGLEDKADSRIMGSIAKKMNVAGFVQKEIPAPLQPFIHHATNQATIRATGGALRATHGAERKIRRELGLSTSRPSSEYGDLPAGYGASGKFANPPQQQAQIPPQQVAQMQQAQAIQGAAQQGAQGASYPMQASYPQGQGQGVPQGYPSQGMATPQQMPPAYVGGYMVGGTQAYNPQAMVMPIPPAQMAPPPAAAQVMYVSPPTLPQAYTAQPALPSQYYGAQVRGVPMTANLAAAQAYANQQAYQQGVPQARYPY